MAGRIIKYLFIFFAMYFLGHFIMTMAYRFGKVPTIAIGILSLIIVIFTFLKTARLSENRKGIFYGIISGLFMWVFFGEFLEHMGIVEIVEPWFFPVLAAYVFIVSFFVYKKYLPVGVSFALGHFGCIWLVHSIGIYQAELLKPQNPEAYQMLRSATGVIFFLTFLFLSFKLFKARIEKAQIAYTLFAFIFLWSVVETLQVFHIIPDYTYYSYWARKISPVSSKNYIDRLAFHYKPEMAKLKNVPLPVKFKKKIVFIKEQYQWENEETKELAGYLLEKLPSQIFLDDFTMRLDENMKQENKNKVDEITLCRVMEESFETTTAVTFNNLVKRYVQKFKEEGSVDKNYYESETAKLKNVPLPDKIMKRLENKTALIKEKYQWESDETKKLACYLLKKLPFPVVMDDFSRKLDKKIKEENKEKVDETMFCQVMEESILDITLPTFNNLITRYVQQFKKERSINKKGGKA